MSSQHRSATVPARMSIIAPIIALLTLVGCGDVHRAEQSLERGDPARAVRLYEAALSRNPDDLDARIGLMNARSMLAEIYAREATDALHRGEPYAAVRLSEEATNLDTRYDSLQQHARRTSAMNILRYAEEAAALGEYDRARQQIDEAAMIAPFLSEPADMRAAINERHAAQLADDARSFAAEGDQARANRAIRRAIELAPNDLSIADLYDDITRIEREHTFERQWNEVRADLDAGRLNRATETLHAMRSLRVHEERLVDLVIDVEAQRRTFEDRLERARQAEAAEEFDAALAMYESALAIGADMPGIREEFTALQQRALAVQAQHDFETAFDAGAWIAAGDAYNRLRQVSPDREMLKQYRTALAREARPALLDVMDRGSRLDALQLIDVILMLEPDDALLRMRQSLREEIIELVTREAGRLEAAGETQAAIELVLEAMEVVNDPRLAALRRSLADG